MPHVRLLSIVTGPLMPLAHHVRRGIGSSLKVSRDGVQAKPKNLDFGYVHFAAYAIPTARASQRFTALHQAGEDRVVTRANLSADCPATGFV